MAIYCKSISPGTGTFHSSTKKSLPMCYLPVCILAFSLQNKAETLRKLYILQTAILTFINNKLAAVASVTLSIQNFKVNTMLHVF